MLYQINTPEKPYTFEASSFTAACVVATLLGGGFYSLWQDGKQVMPVFMFGGVEKWYQRIFGKNFQDVVQEVSPDEISQIYMTILAGKPEERQRYLQELSMIHHSKGTLLNAASQWRPQMQTYSPTVPSVSRWRRCGAAAGWARASDPGNSW